MFPFLRLEIDGPQYLTANDMAYLNGGTMSDLGFFLMVDSHTRLHWKHRDRETL